MVIILTCRICCLVIFLPDVNSSHLQGGVSVAKEVKYADKAQYLPWRPR